jgi:uncharacterized protein
VRVLDDRHRDAVLDALDRDPLAGVFVASRVAAAGLDPRRLGAEMWGWLDEHGAVAALCYSGANLVPLLADDAALVQFAEWAVAQGRRCSSIVGDAALVRPLWDCLAPAWGRAREQRLTQPLLSIDTAPSVAADTAVRRVRLDEVDALLPACIAMFTEEVGVSPVGSDGGLTYRARVEELVRAGRAFARFDDGEVTFKAEVGAATRAVCQVQGVWVTPDQRGRGLSVGGMAAVVEACRRDIAPVVSLYVNDFNVPARKAYEAVGFREVGTFASVLF